MLEVGDEERRPHNRGRQAERRDVPLHLAPAPQVLHLARVLGAFDSAVHEVRDTGADGRLCDGLALAHHADEAVRPGEGLHAEHAVRPVQRRIQRGRIVQITGDQDRASFLQRQHLEPVRITL
jgi:hypothetical protein